MLTSTVWDKAQDLAPNNATAWGSQRVVTPSHCAGLTQQQNNENTKTCLHADKPPGMIHIVGGMDPRCAQHGRKAR